MAEEKKEPTIEEQIKTNVKKTLEDKFIQNVAGSNAVKNDPFTYGKLGVQGANSTYDNFMFSEDANKIRKNIYTQKNLRGNN